MSATDRRVELGPGEAESLLQRHPTTLPGPVSPAPESFPCGGQMR